MDARVRPARPEDKEPLMSFIKDVWGGHDYIPEVWDDWLKDEGGRMFVVEVDGVPVGMNRVRFLEDGSAWFEGARVHPDLRGRGLATKLGENSMRFAKERGVGVFRLTSGSRNKVAHRQIAKIKFEEISRFSVYEPPKRRKVRPGRGAARVTADELPSVVRLIEQSKEFRLGGGVFWHLWSAASLSRDIIRRLARDGEVWRAGRAVAVTRVGGEGGNRWVEVCFVGGPEADSLELVRFLVGKSTGEARSLVFVPQRSPLIHALRKEGFKRNFCMVLYERRGFNG